MLPSGEGVQRTPARVVLDSESRDSKLPPRARRHGKNKWRDRTVFVRSNLDMEHTIRESHGGARGQVSLGLTLTVVLAVACLANALCLYAYI